MSESFDPHHIWLGIRPEERPYSFYRLLGLSDFESNSDAIEDAVERQIAHVRRKAIGKHQELSQKLLNELAAASVLLMDPSKKADYDESLRAEQYRRNQADMFSEPPLVASQTSLPPQLSTTDLTDDSMSEYAVDPPPFSPAAPFPSFVPASPEHVGNETDIRQISVTTSGQRRPSQRSPGVKTSRRKQNWDWKSPVVLLGGLAGAAVFIGVAIVWVFNSGSKSSSPDVKKGKLGTVALEIPANRRHGAELWIDEANVEIPAHGKVSKKVSSGTHSLRFTLKGFQEISQTVSVAAGEETRPALLLLPKSQLELVMYKCDRGRGDLQIQINGRRLSKESLLLADKTQPMTDEEKKRMELDEERGVNVALEPGRYKVEMQSADMIEYETDDKVKKKYPMRKLTRIVDLTTKPFRASLAFEPVPEGSDGQGLIAQYFDGENFETKKYTEVARKLDFSLRTSDKFNFDGVHCIRYTGWLKAAEPGNYRFQVVFDDNLKVELNGQTIIDRWTEGGSWSTGDIWLSGKPEKLVILYRDWGGDAALRFFVRRSDGRVYTQLPAEGLFHDEVIADSAPGFALPMSSSGTAVPIPSRPRLPVSQVPDPSPKPAEPPMQTATIGQRRELVPQQSDLAEHFEQLEAEASKAALKRNPILKAARAAHWIESARTEPSNVKKYAFLEKARLYAIEAKDVLVTTAAARDLGAKFEIDGVRLACESMHEVVKSNPPKATWLSLASILPALESRAATTEAWAALDRLLEATAIHAKSAPAVAKEFRDRRQVAAFKKDLWNASSDAGARLQTDPRDESAHRQLGLFELLVTENRKAALDHLAKSGSNDLGKAAAKISSAGARDDDRLAFADVLWDESKRTKSPEATSRLKAAARLWYGEGLPGLAKEQIDHCLDRLLPAPVASKTPGIIPTSGLGGVASIAPKVSGIVAFPGEEMVIGKDGSVEYPVLAETWYVHDIHFELPVPTGEFLIDHADADNNWLGISWINDRRCWETFFWDSGSNGTWRSGNAEFPPNTPLHFINYATPRQHVLFANGRRVLSSGSFARDLRLKFRTTGNCQVRIKSCKLRPFTAFDAQVLRIPWPPKSNATDVIDHAVTLAGRVWDWADEPILKKPDKYVVPSTGTPMAWVPPGEFLRSNGPSLPATTVQIPHGLWAGVYELTQREWLAKMDANPSRVRGSPFLPVDGVSFAQIGEFCQALTKAELSARRLPNGYVYRIPTEAEWEHLAHAAGGGLDADGFWHWKNSRGAPHEVGLKQKNAFGLYDTLGNYAEFCLDEYAPYPSPPQLREVNPFVKYKKPDFWPVIRGGTSFMNASDCSFDWRDRYTHRGSAYRGFRLVLAPSLETAK